MGLPIELCRALATMNINTPTPIQRASLPVSLAGESVLLCAETGSGKSLAFLLPLVARLKNDELALGINARPKRPRAVVLAPTRELAAQLLGVAKGLSRYAKFSSMGVLGGTSSAAQAKRLQQPVDLLVATPGRLLDLVKDGHVSLGDVRFVVADEADTMAAQGFGAELEQLLSSVVAASAAAKESYKKSAELSAKELAAATTEEEKTAIEAQLKVVRGPFHPSDRGHVQCILAAATVKQSVTSIIQSTFPTTREIKTNMAHKVPDGLFQEFVSVSSGDRALRLLEVLDRGRRMNMNRYAEARAMDGATRDATIIFCNTKDSALFAAKLLRENEYEVAEGHGWVAQRERVVQMEEFMSGKKKILVATDVVARGIDTVNVAHVINFDFPLNPVDYIHRIGRTGRGGGTGRVTNLVTKRDYTLAMAIERATKLGQPIEALSSNKADYVQGRPGMLKANSKGKGESAKGESVPARAPARRAPPAKLGKVNVCVFDVRMDVRTCH
jgi:superfamily II DNA/RNA helicase